MGKRAIGGAVTRRQLLAMIGTCAGSAAMYQAMSSLGFAAQSSFKGPTQLSAAPPGASVLILGAGIAERLRVKRPDELAGQLSLFINGAFVSSQVFSPSEASPLLRATAGALIAAARKQ